MKTWIGFLFCSSRLHLNATATWQQRARGDYEEVGQHLIVVVVQLGEGFVF